MQRDRPSKRLQFVFSFAPRMDLAKPGVFGFRRVELCITNFRATSTGWRGDFAIDTVLTRRRILWGECLLRTAATSVSLATFRASVVSDLTQCSCPLACASSGSSVNPWESEILLRLAQMNPISLDMFRGRVLQARS